MTVGPVIDDAVRDRVEIRALVDGYAIAFDIGDVEGFDALWTDDGVLEVFEDGPERPPTGRLKARTTFPLAFDALSRYAHTMHHVTTHEVVVAGDTATGTTACEAHHVAMPVDEPPEDLVMHIRYRDRFERADGAWRFRYRRVEVLFSELRPVRVTRPLRIVP